jgi:hypothetical protein
VKWFRDQAGRDRSREEKDLLEEEFERTQASFDLMAAIWTELARRPERTPGSAAYAYKQAAMYQELAKECDEWRKRAMKKAAEKMGSSDAEVI